MKMKVTIVGDLVLIELTPNKGESQTIKTVGQSLNIEICDNRAIISTEPTKPENEGI
jgi:hypothetical protein